MNENEPNDNDPSDNAPGDADFDDPSYADISALLAGARADEPVPADVAARLETTLAELTADRRPVVDPESDAETDAETDTGVVPLAARRRSTWAPRLLVAAAAVVVVGAGATGIVRLSSPDHPNASTSAAAGGVEDSAGQPRAASTPRPVPTTPLLKDGQLARLGSRALKSLKGDLDAGRILSFRTATFSNQAATLLSAQVAERSAQVPRSTQSNPGAADGPPMAAPMMPARPGKDNVNGLDAWGSDFSVCQGPASPGGKVSQIRLDGRAAVLVVHPAVAGNQLVEAWSCDGVSVLAAAVIAR